VSRSHANPVIKTVRSGSHLKSKTPGKVERHRESGRPPAFPVSASHFLQQESKTAGERPERCDPLCLLLLTRMEHKNWPHRIGGPSRRPARDPGGQAAPRIAQALAPIGEKTSDWLFPGNRSPGAFLLPRSVSVRVIGSAAVDGRAAHRRPT
jgi:hypothetical protein